MSPIEVLAAELVEARQDADRLAEELAKWGWGDFHYGAQPQEESVVRVLAAHGELVAKRGAQT